MGCEVCTCKVLEGDMQDAVMGYRSKRAEASSMGRFKQLSSLPVPMPITYWGSGSKPLWLPWKETQPWKLREGHTEMTINLRDSASLSAIWSRLGENKTFQVFQIFNFFLYVLMLQCSDVSFRHSVINMHKICLCVFKVIYRSRHTNNNIFNEKIRAKLWGVF